MSESADTVRIGEKVRFWEEQDRINQALIPRVLHMHELLVKLEQNRGDAAEVIARLEAKAVSAERELNALRVELQQLEERFQSIPSVLSHPNNGQELNDRRPAESGAADRLLGVGACGVAAVAVLVIVAGYGAIGGGISVFACALAAFRVVRR